jgi:hypothetical protein
MEVDEGDDPENKTENQEHQAPSSQAGRPSPIVVTSQENLI